MITKELAKQLLQDLGYTVNSSLQYYQMGIDGEVTPSFGDNLDYVYAGIWWVNVDIGTVNGAVATIFRLNTDVINAIEIICGANASSTGAMSKPVFAIGETGTISDRTNLMFTGYRMRI